MLERLARFLGTAPEEAAADDAACEEDDKDGRGAIDANRADEEIVKE